MSLSHGSSSAAGFVAEAPTKPNVVVLSRPRLTAVPFNRVEDPSVEENRLQRRARRQALGLMVASGLVSMLALYGMWTLLRTVI